MVKVPHEDLKEKLACSISPSADFVALKFHSWILTILQVFQLKTGTLLIKKRGVCVESGKAT